MLCIQVRRSRVVHEITERSLRSLPRHVKVPQHNQMTQCYMHTSTEKSQPNRTHSSLSSSPSSCSPPSSSSSSLLLVPPVMVIISFKLKKMKGIYLEEQYRLKENNTLPMYKWLHHSGDGGQFLFEFGSEYLAVNEAIMLSAIIT